MRQEDIQLLLPWEEIEAEAISQIIRVAGYSFTKKLAIMPDCHTGYDMPIGGVALLEGVISPSFVGFDIGCGMCLIKTDLKASKLTERVKKDIFNRVYRTIPVGGGGEHKTTPTAGRVHQIPPDEFKSASGDASLNAAINAKRICQFGTLGSGNHFIELGINNDGEIAVTIHSGSRNIGHTIATFYMDKAKKECVDRIPGFLRIESDLGQSYLQDMNYALAYALGNRLHMMYALLDVLGAYQDEDYDFINENHNHAEVTTEGVLHRKGATPAETDALGVIPGNMRDGVVVTRGLGNEQYLCSASHGAGRKMSRSAAKTKVPLEKFEKSMHGIVAKVDKGTLDESPFAYKHLGTVIERQAGIVIEVIDHFKPLINVKG